MVTMDSLQRLIFVLLCWVIVLTIGLPITIALVCCKTFRSKWFVWFYVNISGESQKSFTAPNRKKALQLLKDNLPFRSKSAPLQVLEIGAGEALNLQYYPDNCDVTFVDPNKHFDSYCKENAEKYPGKVVSWKMVRQRAEDMTEVADNSLDVVISTYVHCSCKDTQAVLREVRRVLKPGGKYLFLDHVSYPKDELLSYIAQRIIFPLWYLCYDGCHVHKDVEAEIRKSRFSDVICHRLTIPKASMVRHQLVGITTK